jgi:hypothetical protein
LLAELLELVSVFRREFLMSKGVKSAPESMHYPRPWEKDKPTTTRDGKRRVSAGHLANLLMKG